LSFRFRKLKEEESRRKVFLEKAEQTEQAGTQAGIVDGKQNSDASGDNIDEQVRHFCNFVDCFITYFRN
jgi:hypothetical protein